MLSPTRRPLRLAVLAPLLAACAAPTTPPGPTHDITVTYYAPPIADAPAAFGAAVTLIDPNAVLIASEDASPSAALIEGRPGLLIGPVALIGEDGTLELDLPQADEELEAVLVPAAELLEFVVADELACPVTASDESVKVTPLGFDAITVPGISPLTGYGATYGLITTEEVEDLDDSAALDRLSFYGLVYADGPVEVTATDDGCVTEESLHAELSLEAGWNWVEWRPVFDETDTFSHRSLEVVDEPQELKLTYEPAI